MTNELRNLLTNIRDQATSALSLLGNEPEQPDTPIPDGPWPKPYFGGRYAPWAVPVTAGLRPHPRNDRYRRELFGMSSGEFNVNAYRWATAIFHFDSRTPRARLDIKHDNWCNLSDGDLVPWDPDWVHADDGDSYTIMASEETGECFLIWQPKYDRGRGLMRCGTSNIIRTQAVPHKGAVADIRLKENAFWPSRAAGIALPHMVTTREEVENGLIPHCLAIGLPQPSRNNRFAPAVKHIGRTGTPESGRLGTGARIAFDFDQAHLEQWASTFDGKMRDHAMTIGTCVRDYGMILVDNGGNRSKKRGAAQFEENLTADWESIGFPKSEAQSMLFDLIKPVFDRSWIVEEPKFPGDDKNRVAVYDNIDYPEGYR